ncbi:MAG: acyl-CoA thioesterase [Luteolibacter sp.]
MNFRWLNAILWGNSVALSWMWGLGLFFSVQMTFMFGLQGLLLFAIPNALGLMLFGFLTQIVAKRHSGGQESLAIFFDKFSKPFRLIFYIYQVVALTLTVFALSKYLFGSLELVPGALKWIYLSMVVFVVLAAGCLFGEEFGIQRIKFGHAMFGGLLAVCVGVVLFSLHPLVPENIPWGAALPTAWKGPQLFGYAVPLLVGLLVGPWLDLQHWQRAIQIHRENTSIRSSYFFGGLIFFLMLLFHGCLAAWVLAKTHPSPDDFPKGLDSFRYAHDLVVNYIDGLPAASKGLLPAAYYAFLGICALTTLDSGYVALKWFLGANLGKSDNLIVGMLPKRLLESPIPTFLVILLITLVGLLARLELEYFMVFYASFFVGYASLAVARCFVPNSQHALPQIRMFSLASISLVIFAFGYCTGASFLLILGSLLPLIYVLWLVFNTDLLRVVTEKAGEVMEAASEIPALKAIAKTATVATGSDVVAPHDHHALGGHFEGKWFVYSMIATYQDTNSVGNVYFGMYGLFVGKTRELFFNVAMPDFDLKTTKFYILTRSFEHKFVREAREFDTITIKIKVADFNRKFCTLEHQIFGSENELLGKGKQSLLFVSSKDYSLLDIPSEVYTAFMPYT